MVMRYVLIVCFSIIVGSLSVPSSAAEVPQADSDKALVVFYRVKSFKGGAIRFNVQYSEGLIGTLGSGTYLYKQLGPGQYQFWSQVISQDSITLNVEAGKTYYVKGETQIGVFAGRPKFTQVSESQAKADLAKL
jgi:hypothetical protein